MNLNSQKLVDRSLFILRLIIAGSRDFDDYTLVRDSMNKIFENRDTGNLSIISGCCSGADNLGEQLAAVNGIPCIKFPADWKHYGKAAGPIRNEEMAQFASEDNGMLLAFWDGVSKGTRNMIQTARKYALEVHVVRYQK